MTGLFFYFKERLVKTPPEEEEEAEEGPESWQELLDSVKENMEQNGGISPLLLLKWLFTFEIINVFVT